MKTYKNPKSKQGRQGMTGNPGTTHFRQGVQGKFHCPGTGGETGPGAFQKYSLLPLNRMMNLLRSSAARSDTHS